MHNRQRLPEGDRGVTGARVFRHWLKRTGKALDSEKHKVFALSRSQQNIWNLEQAYPGTSINHISTTVSIRGRIDFALLQESIRLVLKADATLRTRITLQDGKPVQYFAPCGEERFDIYDFPIRIRKELKAGKLR